MTPGEYVLVRLALGAFRLAWRALTALVELALWLATTIVGLVLRPLSREVARAAGRLRGTWPTARRRVGPV